MESGGDNFPSEHDLAAQHDTSRETVSKALHMLAQNGYIQKIRGKGSIVLNREKMQFSVSGHVSFKELAQMLGKETKTTVYKFGLETPSELLDLRGYDHMVVVRNYVFLEDSSLFQYTESRHRLDKLRFVDFARRGK